MLEFIPKDLEIVDCSVMPLVETAPHGALKEAVLILRGKAITSTELKCLLPDGLKDFHPSFDSAASELEAWNSCPSKASILGELPDRAVFLRAGRGGEVGGTVGIILEQLEDNTGRFRRIGAWTLLWSTKNVDLKRSVKDELGSAWQDAMTREWKII
jgi:hypothetical protein